MVTRPLASDQARHNTFQVAPELFDEKIIHHDHSMNEHHESEYSHLQQNTTHPQSPHDLALASSLTRVQRGYWKSSAATLICFRFQFLGGDHHHRFTKADIDIHFIASLPEGVDKEGLECSIYPIIVAHSPKDFTSWDSETKGQEPVAMDDLRHPTGQFRTVTANLVRDWNTHGVSSIAPAVLPSHDSVRPDHMKFWAREGLLWREGEQPLELQCAVVV
jgi:hypothetical protein